MLDLDFACLYGWSLKVFDFDSFEMSKLLLLSLRTDLDSLFDKISQCLFQHLNRLTKWSYFERRMVFKSKKTMRSHD